MEMSKKIAFIFPGQGSQSVGMGRDLYNNYDAAKRVLIPQTAFWVKAYQLFALKDLKKI